MRILLLHSDPDPPPAGRGVRSAEMRGVAAGLLRAGHTVDGALASRADHADLAPLQSRGLTLHALPRRAGREELRRLLAGCRPDVVFEQLAPLAPHAAEAAAQLGVLHVYEVHTPLAPPPRAGREDPDEFERCLRRGFAASRGALAPSADLAEWARRYTPLGFEVSLLASPAEAHSPVVPGPVAAEWARAIIGARPGEFVVGFCGSFKPWHDLDTLVAAAALFGATRPVRLVLSGDGPPRGHLLALTHRHQLPTVFAGAVSREEGHALMRCCDTIAIPYARSGADFSPLKLVEAMSAARPIVATDTAATRRVLGEGALGMLVPAGDASALARAFEKLATQPALREQLADAARGRAVEHYSWDVAAERRLAFAQACRSRAENCA